jgi:alpha-L-fucosidase 2
MSRIDCLLPLLLTFINPSTAKSLWSTTPANVSDIIRTTYPLGNGRLGAMPIGPPGAETLTLNLDTLWSGGPFSASVSPIISATHSNRTLMRDIGLQWWEPELFYR